ncbi:unnamed protein product [Dovyalis caffra]|uniref:Uncharacterized protein n=1 Tax=Dovyalis caffra TaxID=77055 RepID=A0AAV1RY84_9ROSI|nr:unnamed protein product [Dovyalis caffra]
MKRGLRAQSEVTGRRPVLLVHGWCLVGPLMEDQKLQEGKKLELAHAIAKYKNDAVRYAHVVGLYFNLTVNFGLGLALPTSLELLHSKCLLQCLKEDVTDPSQPSDVNFRYQIYASNQDDASSQDVLQHTSRLDREWGLSEALSAVSAALSLSSSASSGNGRKEGADLIRKGVEDLQDEATNVCS